MPGPDFASQSHSVAFKYKLGHLRGSLLTPTLEKKQNTAQKPAKAKQLERLLDD